MTKPKYKIGSKLVVTKDFDLLDIFGENPVHIEKGTEVYVTSNGVLVFPDGTESHIDYGYTLEGYALEDIADYVWKALNNLVDIADMAISYGYEAENAQGDEDYEEAKAQITNEFKEEIKDSLATLLRNEDT